MLKSLELLLPVFIPSRQFFKEIAPSPRIEFSLNPECEEQERVWQELRLRPQSLSFTTLIKKIFFNASWNHALYVNNCAERLIVRSAEKAPVAESRSSSFMCNSDKEIFKAIRSELFKNGLSLSHQPSLQFRLVFVSREAEGLRRDVLYLSPITHVGGEC